ncbi:MAG: outer membrane beta-barrel protein [Chitinophagaceae bacterium]
MQKIIIHICFLLCLSISTNAQHANRFRLHTESYWNNKDFENTKWFFSLVLGPQISWYNIQKNKNFYSQDTLFSIKPNLGGGFTAGIDFTWKPNKYIELKTNLFQFLIEQRSITYTITKPGFLETPIMTKVSESAFLRFPVIVKINSDRINNFRVFVFSGFKYDIEVASNFSQKVDITRISFNKSDWGLQGGFGFHFYLPTVVLTTQFQFDYGFNNLIIPNSENKFLASISEIHNRSISLKLIVEGLFGENGWVNLQ